MTEKLKFSLLLSGDYLSEKLYEHLSQGYGKIFNIATGNLDPKLLCELAVYHTSNFSTN